MSNWFSYDWELQGSPARFTVDLSAAEALRDAPALATLLYLTCTPVQANAAAFSKRESKRLDGVLKRCLAILADKALYVGLIDLPAQRRYYFYAADARLLVPLYAYCGEETECRLACAKADEPNRQSYFRLLYPDAAKRQAAENATYIAFMHKRGDLLDAYRRIQFYLYFPSLQALSGCARDAMTAGFAVGQTGFVAEREPPHLIVLHAPGKLEWHSLTELSTRAITLAEAYGGVFDHLDAQTVKRR